MSINHVIPGCVAKTGNFSLQSTKNPFYEFLKICEIEKSRKKCLPLCNVHERLPKDGWSIFSFNGRGMFFHSQQSILEKGGFDRPARKEEGDRKKLFSNHEK